MAASFGENLLGEVHEEGLDEVWCGSAYFFDGILESALLDCAKGYSFFMTYTMGVLMLVS